MTDKIKSAREEMPESRNHGDLIRWLDKHNQTILKALSAYERLQRVDLEELADAVQILETWDTSRDGYIKPKYFPMRDVLKAARLVADIRGIEG